MLIAGKVLQIRNMLEGAFQTPALAQELASSANADGMLPIVALAQLPGISAITNDLAVIIAALADLPVFATVLTSCCFALVLVLRSLSRMYAALSCRLAGPSVSDASLRVAGRDCR
jgi:hypothetical protein